MFTRFENWIFRLQRAGALDSGHVQIKMFFPAKAATEDEGRALL